MRKYVGVIVFIDSEREDRHTNVANFEIIADWFQSVREYFQQDVMTGEYDGSEILVNVYEYGGPKGIYASVDGWEFVIDSDTLIASKSIMNPWYV